MHLRTLGGLALEGTDFQRRKPLLLLAYLALEGPATRRFLAELFWPDARDGRDSLSSALRRLRASGAPVVTDGERLGCDVPCDAVELLAMLHGGDDDGAVRGYAGALFGGVALDLDEELEDWVYAQREGVAAQVRAARVRLAERALRAGDAGTAREHAEAALQVAGAPPLDAAELAPMHDLLARTNSPLAAAVRRDARSLGIELGPPEGGGAQSEPPSGAAASLPQPATSFVGRQAELARLHLFLADPDCRLITLHGPGGVGKTRTAAEALRRLAGDGTSVAFAPLESVGDGEGVILAVAQALGIALHTFAPAAEQVAAQIGERRVTIVLDAFEHLASTGAPPNATPAAVVRDLLRSCPRLRIVVTSRRRLRLYEEHVVPLRGLPVAGGGTDEAPALRLFEERARKADADFRLDDAALQAAAEVCRLVDGFPLGIELAASWVAALPAKSIAEQLRRDLGSLPSRDLDRDERHASLRHTFELSWRLMGEDEQRCLRGLAVFRGGFRRPAAQRVAGASLERLADLIDHGVLSLLPGGRLARHPLIEQFTEEKLAERPQEERRRRSAHGRYYLRSVAGLADDLLGGPGVHRALAWIDEELANLRAAWGWGVAHGRWRELAAAAWPLAHYCELQGRYAVGIPLFAEALTAGRGADATELGAISGVQAFMLFRAGRNEEALAAGRAAVERLLPRRAPSGNWGLWSAYQGMTGASLMLGDFEQGVRYQQDVLHHARLDREHAGDDPALVKMADVTTGTSLEAMARLEILLGH